MKILDKLPTALCLVLGMLLVMNAPAARAQAQENTDARFEGLGQYVQEHFQYPSAADKVYAGDSLSVRITIGQSGKVTGVKIDKGLSHSIDSAVTALLLSMPAWQPSMHKGKARSQVVARTIVLPGILHDWGEVPETPVPAPPVPEPAPEPEQEVFMVVEQRPEYPKLTEYLSENLKYPEEAREQGIEGRVILSFIIDKEGDVSDIKVLRGVGGGCTEEAVRVVKNMGRWKPGYQRGKPVMVRMTLPVVFKLK